MKPLLEAELLKLRTTRTFFALAAVAIATSVLITTLTALLSEPTQADVLADVFTSDTSSFFILILAIVGVSGEWRHRTITSSLLAAPDRLRFLAAKTLAFGAAGLVLSLAISIAVAIFGYVILSSRDLPVPELGDLAGQVGRNAIVAALLGAFGVGIGSLVRNQAIAIVGVLLISLALEPLLWVLVPGIGPFTPLDGLPRGIQDIPGDDMTDDVDLLPPLLATLAMLAWIGAFFTAGFALLRARDVE